MNLSGTVFLHCQADALVDDNGTTRFCIPSCAPNHNWAQFHGSAHRNSALTITIPRNSVLTITIPRLRESAEFLR